MGKARASNTFFFHTPTVSQLRDYKVVFGIFILVVCLTSITCKNKVDIGKGYAGLLP
jgi:hypothetical protein